MNDHKLPRMAMNIILGLSCLNGSDKGSIRSPLRGHADTFSVIG
jgi:hypothetical protein